MLRTHVRTLSKVHYAPYRSGCDLDSRPLERLYPSHLRSRLQLCLDVPDALYGDLPPGLLGHLSGEQLPEWHRKNQRNVTADIDPARHLPSFSGDHGMALPRAGLIVAMVLSPLFSA